jgi:solute carrier family 35 protein F1/2
VSMTDSDTTCCSGTGGTGSGTSATSTSGKYAMLVPILHGQFISVLISGTGFFASLLADRSANCPMFMSLLTYALLSLHLFWLNSAQSGSGSGGQSAGQSEGYVDLDGEESQVQRSDSHSHGSSSSSSSGSGSASRADGRTHGPLTGAGSADQSSMLIVEDNSSYEMHCPWYLYLFLALLDVEANVIIISAYNYTSITSIMLLDCFSIPCVMMLSFCFLGAKYRRQHIVGVVICLFGMGCIILSDSSNLDDIGPSQGDDGGDDQKSSNAVKGDILCLIGTSLYALSNVLQEAMVKTKDRVEYLGMLGFFGTVISIIQTSIFERKKLLYDIEWNTVTILYTTGFVLCLFLMYRNTSAFLTTSDAALFNLSLLTSDVYAVIFSYFVFGYTVSWLYFVALVLAVTGVLLYHTAGPVHDNVEAAVERFKNVMLRGMRSYADYRDRYKFIYERKDSDTRQSFKSIHHMDNYDCIVDECSGLIANSTIVVDHDDHDPNAYSY